MSLSESDIAEVKNREYENFYKNRERNETEAKALDLSNEDVIAFSVDISIRSAVLSRHFPHILESFLTGKAQSENEEINKLLEKFKSGEPNENLLEDAPRFYELVKDELLNSAKFEIL